MADTPEEVAEWVLWSVCNDPDVAAQPQETAREHIVAAIRKAEARGFAKGLEAVRQACECDACYGVAPARTCSTNDAVRRAIAPQAPPEVAAAEPKP